MKTETVELTGYDPITMEYRKGAPLHVGDLIAFNGVTVTAHGCDRTRIQFRQ